MPLSSAALSPRAASEPNSFDIAFSRRSVPSASLVVPPPGVSAAAGVLDGASDGAAVFCRALRPAAAPLTAVHTMADASAAPAMSFLMLKRLIALTPDHLDSGYYRPNAGVVYMKKK